MSDTLWRDGLATVSFAPGTDAAPAREPGREPNGRWLHAESVWLSLICLEGRWRAQSVMVSGRWMRKRDGQIGKHEGKIAYPGVVSAGLGGAPLWLVDRVRKLLDALNAAMTEAQE